MTYSINNIFKVTGIALAAVLFIALPISFAKAADLDGGGYDYFDTSYPTYSTGGYDYIDTSYPNYSTGYGTQSYSIPSYSIPSYSMGGYSIPSYSYPVSTGGPSSTYINSTNINSNSNVNTNNISINNAPQSGGVQVQPYIVSQPQPVYYPQPQPIYYPQPQPLAYNNTAPYVTLAAVPYTGLDLGFLGTIAYWSFLIFWCLVAAYLIAVKRVQNKMLGGLNNFLFGKATEKQTDRFQGDALKSHGVKASPLVSVVSSTPSIPRGMDSFVFAQVNRARA